jgi:hypothetical protein
MAINVNGPTLNLRFVDGFTLPERHRALLKPGAAIRNRDGELHRLPRFFFEVESWATALETQLTAHFALWEFMDVDLHEPTRLRFFPRYVPCAVTALASALEVLRAEVGAPIRIAANGGYRSASHDGSRSGSPHSWGTAANIYRIGAELLDAQDRIERYAATARRLLPFAWVRPYGHDVGFADDHLHIDVGYVTLVPPGASEQHDGAVAHA